MNTPIDVDVVVHTHWDREWYMDRETTLARLLAVMAQVAEQLDAGVLDTFLFDGQMVAMRDLLSVAPPALQARLRAHAASGRLVLGPWYVSADELLVSGESLLRNLEFGIADAAALGPVQRIGYLVDTFGHTAQMPQLLAEFDIHHAVLWRGADALHDRFEWAAPDGTRVHTVFLTQGYYLNPLHGPKWRDELAPLLDRLEARRTPRSTAPLLLMHGGDHLAPSPLLAERFAVWNALPESRYTLRASTLAAHVALHIEPAAQTLHGELRHNTQAFVLPDVLSTRRHLKLAHQQLEDRLLGEIEPLVVAFGSAPPPSLERAWRTLVEQQAHDSICGCSTDAVHDEMAQRFVSLNQQLDALRQALCVQGGLVRVHQYEGDAAAAAVFADDSRATLFNPLPVRRSGWWVVSLFLHGPAPAALRVRTAGGAELQQALLGVQAAQELISPLDEFPQMQLGHQLELAVWASLPGLSGLALQVEPAPARAPTPAAVPRLGSIDNAAWAVSLLPDGQIALTDRLAGATAIPGVFELLAELDAGDSYNFSPPAAPHAVRQARWVLREQRQDGVVQTLVLHTAFDLPVSLNAEHSGAANETVRAEATLRLRLVGDEPALQAQFVWLHRARDCRVRLLLPGFGAEVHSTTADSAFALITRPVRLAQIPAEPSRQEMPVAVQPSLSTVLCGPWAVVHRGLHEHSVIEQDGAGSKRALALTLVRGVGWLSRRDLRTRGVGAGPDIETPGAQCLGEHRFDVHLIARADTAEPAETLAHAATLRRPPLLLRGHPRTKPAGIDIGNAVVTTSSTRRLADGRIELRLWNPSGEPQALALAPDGWVAVHADGRPLAPSAQPFVLRPFGILTLREVLKQGPSA